VAVNARLRSIVSDQEGQIRGKSNRLVANRVSSKPDERFIQFDLIDRHQADILYSGI